MSASEKRPLSQNETGALRASSWLLADWLPNIDLGRRFIMLVNNLQLPAVLVKAIKEGRWTRASPAHYLREIVPSTPIAWCFYSVEQMSRETEVLRRYAPISEFTTLGECRTDDRRPEGQDDLPSRVASVTLDISRAVCIADAGHDCPICLDYATNPSIPSVRGLNVVSPGNGWQPIAADIDSFLEMLELLPLVEDHEEARRQLPPRSVYITEDGHRWFVESKPWWKFW